MLPRHVASDPRQRYLSGGATIKRYPSSMKREEKIKKRGHVVNGVVQEDDRVLSQCSWLCAASVAAARAASPGFNISSEGNVPSVVPLLQIKNRRLSNYGALSPRNVSLLHFKLCSERWQTNDRFNFYQEEKHMAGANEVSSLILPLTETIWTK